jgi:hypothetical protein
MVNPTKIGGIIEASRSAMKHSIRECMVDPRRYDVHQKKKKKKEEEVRSMQDPNHQVTRVIVRAVATDRPKQVLQNKKKSAPWNTRKEN